MDISKYKSVEEWYEDLKKIKGGNPGVPLQMCMVLSQAMDNNNLTFPEAWRYLIKNNTFLFKSSFFTDTHSDSNPQNLS